MKNDFLPVVGHKFQFHGKPLPKMGWAGIVYCEVFEVVPNQKLVYTWKGGPRPGVVGLDTLLTWTISPDGEGTKMVLEQVPGRLRRNKKRARFLRPVLERQAAKS